MWWSRCPSQHRGVGDAGPLPHVVGEAPAPGEQCRVLDAFHRASDETGKGARGIRGLGMRSVVQGTIGEMVAGNGSGDSPGYDGSSLVRAPTRAAYSFADTDRAVIFPIRLRVRPLSDSLRVALKEDPSFKWLPHAPDLATLRERHPHAGRRRSSAGAEAVAHFEVRALRKIRRGAFPDENEARSPSRSIRAHDIARRERAADFLMVRPVRMRR